MKSWNDWMKYLNILKYDQIFVNILRYLLIFYNILQYFI